ncbi:hypothetical protein C8R47DRAFT_1288774 [Mycena vitilis]|nr:hypothetical protein C8R47DRAFT_1288774 [Mycena vitilis]
METAIYVPPALLDVEAPEDGIYSEDNDSSFRVALLNRLAEAKFVLLAEFLEGCGSEILPYRAKDTFQVIFPFSPVCEIHDAHQIRLAHSMHRLLACENASDILDSICTSPMFKVYYEVAHGAPLIGVPWLRNSTARALIHDTLAKYAERVPVTMRHIRGVLDGMKLLHGDEE